MSNALDQLPDNFKIILNKQAIKDIRQVRDENNELMGIQLAFLNESGICIGLYDPEIYLDIIRDGYYKKIEAAWTLNKKLRLALKCKNDIIHQIEYIRSLSIFKKVPNGRYDFTGILQTLESTCDTLEKRKNNRNGLAKLFSLIIDNFFLLAITIVGAVFADFIIKHGWHSFFNLFRLQ